MTDLCHDKKKNCTFTSEGNKRIPVIRFLCEKFDGNDVSICLDFCQSIVANCVFCAVFFSPFFFFGEFFRRVNYFLVNREERCERKGRRKNSLGKWIDSSFVSQHNPNPNENIVFLKRYLLNEIIFWYRVNVVSTPSISNGFEYWFQTIESNEYKIDPRRITKFPFTGTILIAGANISFNERIGTII